MATASTHQTYQAPVTCGICERCEDVNWYCRDCKGNLCDPCQAIHVQAPIYRKHSVIPILEGLKLQAAEEECGTHTSYPCSFHCNTCHTPVCNKCITSDHRRHDICDIEAALQEVQREIKEYLRKLETTYLPQCKSEEAKIKQKIAECKKVTISIKSNINDRRQEIIKEVNRICDDMINKAEDEKKHHILDMDKAIQKLQDTAKELEVMMTKGKEALKKLPSEQIKFNQEKPSVTHLDVPKPPTIHDVTFEPGTVNRAQLAVQIGELLCSTDQQIHVSILNRSKLDSGIYTVHAVNGNHAWVTVYSDNKELRLVDTKGKVKECINTKFNISNFEVTTSGDIITTDYNGTCIRILTQTGQVTNTINTTPNKPSGVCLGNNNQEIVVCVNTPDNSSSKLVVYSRDGKEIRTINYTDKPVGLCIDQTVTQNNRGDYCVVHRGHNKVYVVDSNGRLRYTYDGSGAGKMKKIFLPYDICSDIYNHMFISDFNNHNIHMMNDEGKFLRFILTEQDGITLPTALCIDKDGRLWVGQYNGGLYVVKYLQ